MQQFLHNLVKESGDLILQSLGKNTVVRAKEYRDIVTDVDVRIEKKIVRAIKKRYPSHAILAEESDNNMETVKKSEYIWVIDPVDGTVNFASGIPLVSVVIGLLHRGVRTFGISYAPYLNELFFAERGKGSYLNGKRIHPSQKKLSESLVNVSFSASFSPALVRSSSKINQRFALKSRGIRILESGALTSCYVACGRLGAKISYKTVAFDNAPSSLIVEEAGGVVTDFQGRAWNLGMKNMICSSQALYPAVRHVLGS